MRRPGALPRALLALTVGLVTLGLGARLTEAQGAGRRLPPSPVAVDAKGQVIGAFTADGVLVRVGDRLALVGIGRDVFTGGAAIAVFESSDCTGPAFLLEGTPHHPTAPPDATAPALPPQLLAPIGLGPPSVLLAPAGPLESREIRSQWNARLAPPLCGAGEAATVRSVYPTETLMNLGVFTPPFRIE